MAAPKITLQEAMDFMSQAEATYAKYTDEEIRQDLSDVMPYLEDPFFRLYRLSTADGRYPTYYPLLHPIGEAFFAHDTDISIYYRESDGMSLIVFYAGSPQADMTFHPIGYTVSDVSETPIPFMLNNIPATLTFTRHNEIKIHFSSNPSGQWSPNWVVMKHKFPKGTFSIKPLRQAETGEI